MKGFEEDPENKIKEIHKVCDWQFLVNVLAQYHVQFAALSAALLY